MKVVLYARVSTTKESQDTENQILAMKAACRNQGWTIVKEFEDRQSGKTEEREQFQAMFAYLAKTKGCVVYFWALDRLSREGTLETLQHLKRINDLGHDWKSHTENYLHSVGPFRDAIIAILAALAKQQRIRLSERVQAGLERVRQNGSRSGRAIGRPKIEFDEERGRKLVEDLGVRQAAEEMGIKPSTLYVRLNGRKQKSVLGAAVWGRIEDGLFREEEGGETIVRYDRQGLAWCANHHVELVKCIEKHGGG